MSRVLQKLILQLISTRWVILLALFLYHFRMDQKYSFGLTLLIGFNILLTWFHFNWMKKTIWRTVVVLEIVSLVILNVCYSLDLGQLYYLFTTFFIGSMLFSKKASLVSTFIYCILATILSLEIQERPLIEGISSLYFFWGFLFYLLMATILGSAGAVFRKLTLILHFSKKLATIQSVKLLYNITETYIKKLMKMDRCYICLYENNSFIDDWYIQYYTRILRSNDSYRVERKMKNVLIESYLGDLENFLFYPLRVHKANENIGGLLIPLEKKNQFSHFDFILLRMLLSYFLNHLHLLVLQQELASSMKDEVRNKMAQDMHDGLAQQLFFLSAQIFQIKSNLSKGRIDELNHLIEAMEKQTSSCQNEVRSFIAHLKGEQRDTNIFDAIHQLVKRLTYNSSVKINIECQGNIVDEIVEIEEAVYRIIEESVNNILKHASASLISILVEVTMVQWTIKVIDDGVGFQQSSHQEHSSRSYGVSGLKERVGNLGGHFTLRSVVGNGTEITAIIPRGGMKNYA
ncbi:sensor histidine kinase [Bacillus sp. CGMCC 1.16607]|uniref:sensor histidine kinase n=1 Tax=Bacillus sp. CGMCC 1.16607 TaxID=3351842 RepID=UPI00362DCF8F